MLYKYLTIVNAVKKNFNVYLSYCFSLDRYLRAVRTAVLKGEVKHLNDFHFFKECEIFYYYFFGLPQLESCDCLRLIQKKLPLYSIG